MASKKPLVLYSGEIKELQSGDSVTTDSNSYTAKAVGTLAAYTAVRIAGAGSVAYADYKDSTLGPAIGLTGSSITDDTTGTILLSGVVTMAGLVTGSAYYVGSSGSIIVDTALPTGTGSYVQKIGIALSTTQLKLNPEDYKILG